MIKNCLWLCFLLNGDDLSLSYRYSDEDDIEQNMITKVIALLESVLYRWNLLLSLSFISLFDLRRRYCCQGGMSTRKPRKLDRLRIVCCFVTIGAYDDNESIESRS